VNVGQNHSDAGQTERSKLQHNENAVPSYVRARRTSKHDPFTGELATSR
jgi:hypothetical protein